MDLQAIFVGIIIFLAFLYTTKKIWKRIKSFSPKTACGSDCGCDANSSGKSSTHIIKQ
jgi:hypothetical protein